MPTEVSQTLSSPSQTDGEKKEIAFGVDPGNTTGWAVLTYNGGDVLFVGQTKADDFVKVLDRLYAAFTVKVIVYEDFILYANRAQQQTGSRFYASQVIGMLKVYATNNNTELIRQPAQILKMAPKVTGMEKPKLSHDKTHYVDAFNHVAWYLIRTKRMPSVLEENLARKAQ